MKTMKYLFLILPFLMFSQQEVDLSNMTSGVLLGDSFFITPECNGSQNDEFISVGDIDFNGNRIVLNNSTLTVNGTVQFGGAFQGYCESTLCVDGIIINTDPPDPGGNPFGNTEGVPPPPPGLREYQVNGCINLPNNEVVGWYEIVELLEENNGLVLNTNSYDIKNNYSYDKLTSTLTVKDVEFIKVYNLLGKELLSTEENSIKLNVDKQLLIIVTNRGSFKIIT